MVAALLMAALSGCGGQEPPPLPDTEDGSTVLVPGLSADQSRTVERFGYPDHFFISIDPESSDRVERWIYFARGEVLDFDNGRLFGEEPVTDESKQYPATDLRPQDFDTLMAPGEASLLLGDPLYTHEVQDSLMPENTIIVYAKAILLFRTDKLIGVDTQVAPPVLSAP